MTPFRTDLALPEVSAAHALAKLVTSVIGKRRGLPAASAARDHARWGAAFFGLDAVGAFRDAAPEQRAAILERCGRGLMQEAFYIEKSGVAFAAKMILLAETSDERQLYAMFAADEAAHLSGIAAFYRERLDDPAGQPFLQLLSGAIDDGDRASLQLVVQVVLEGWGLAHYRALRDACGCPELRGLLTAILADEAAHHGSGVLLRGERPLGAESVERSVDVLRRFLAMVQVGPQSVAGAVQQVVGPLATPARRRLFEQLEAERHSAARLAQLRALLGKISHARPVIEQLEAAGSFTPHPVSELV